MCRMFQFELFSHFEMNRCFCVDETQGLVHATSCTYLISSGYSQWEQNEIKHYPAKSTVVAWMGTRSACSAGLALLVSISSRDGWFVSERSGGGRKDGGYSDKGKAGNIRSQKQKLSHPFFYSHTQCPYLLIIPASFASTQRKDCWGREDHQFCFDVLKTKQLNALKLGILKLDQRKEAKFSNGDYCHCVS